MTWEVNSLNIVARKYQFYYVLLMTPNSALEIKKKDINVY